MLRSRKGRQRAVLKPQAVSQVQTASADAQVLRLLSFNMQVGIHTASYHHYLTRGWQHFLPHTRRIQHLDHMGQVFHRFDLVALQEADGGSLRSGFINQVEYLAERAAFPFWYQQLNRNLGRIAQHSNGLLSRLPPLSVEDHGLPGMLPGRGAILARFGQPDNPLVLVIAHLSLSARAQDQQLAYIHDLIERYRHVVLMGDMNCHAERLLRHSPLRHLNLHTPQSDLATYPSWQPMRGLDHILVSSTLKVRRLEALDQLFSDHLPVAMEIALPDELRQSLCAAGEAQGNAAATPCRSSGVSVQRAAAR